MNATLIRNAVIVTMDKKRRIVHGDLRFDDGEIRALGPDLRAEPGDHVIDADGAFVIPGLIQAHTHLCQALFRGFADDLELLDWLKKKIWPFEHAHTEHSLRASAQIGLLEMQLAGTTSILDMGTTKLHEVVFEEAERSGIRYWGGNCLMDLKASSGPLFRETEDSLRYCQQLIDDWHLKTPLLQYAISPRFVLSCSDEMLAACQKLQKKHGLIFHTHASENLTEVALVKKRTKMRNVQFLNKIGCLHKKSVIAHGIHLSPGEVAAMVRTKAGLTHCPSSNLKLASGIARIEAYRKKGMKIALGSDGAPCNNSMDPFIEMRLAALLQKPLFGPTALPAQAALALATNGGASVLNAADKTGSLETGKRADVVIVRRDHPGVSTVRDPYSALVYSCTGRDVSDVWIDGLRIVNDRTHLRYDARKVIASARQILQDLVPTVG